MQMSRALGGSLAALAMIGMAAPAAAGDRSRRNHRHDKVDVGDVALGAVLLGGILAIAGSKKKHVEPVAYASPPEPQPENASVAVEDMTADDAADTCAAAAEGQGAKMARIAQVAEVTSVDRSGERWFVAGTIQLRDGYREARGRSEGFRCSIGSRGVPEVRIDGQPELVAAQP
jgi:hypothetical protein